MNSKTFTMLIFCALLSCATVALYGNAGSAQAQTTRRKSTTPPQAVTYACPMHPEVTSKKRGRFLFTTCKGVYSPMTANLVKAQNYPGERVGRGVVMISLTVDPLTDTPAVLKKYADSFKTRPGWYFLTGDKKNVDWVLYKLGGYVEDKQQHSSVLIIGNEATGEWMKVHAMSNPTEIANAVVKLLAPQKEGIERVVRPAEGVLVKRRNYRQRSLCP
ncbi:MAG TPA: SCO family protein [Pyrinomonadaceae bacterium]|jgi:hypothetical protein